MYLSSLSNIVARFSETSHIQHNALAVTRLLLLADVALKVINVDAELSPAACYIIDLPKNLNYA